MAERRGASRIDVNLAARYSSNKITLSGKVANLSRHGLFLVSEFCDGHGAVAHITIDMPDGGAPLALTGQVVRTAAQPQAPAGMAIQFHRLQGPARQKLANFMIERSYGV